MTKLISIFAMLIVTMIATDNLRPLGTKPPEAVTVVCASAKDQYNYNQFGIIGPSCRVL